MLKMNILKYSLIILGISMVGCNPFISKDLRIKNKCNRKLERVTKKCPELLKKDTLIANLDTTIVTNEVRVDTLVSTKHDTIEIIKDKFRVRIVNLIDTLLVQGGCDADTIIVTRTIKVPYNVVKPIELTPFEKFANWMKPYWWLLIVILTIYIVYKKLLN